MQYFQELEEFLKNNRRSTLLIGATITTFLFLYSYHLDRQVEIQKHNVDVYYKSLTCSDLPISNESSVEECEEAIGSFMMWETGFFSRGDSE